MSYALDAGPEDERSYDFFLPLRPGGALVVFVQSRFWSERQPEKLVISGFVKGAVQAGHAVAVIRHRTALGIMHPGPIRDVALGYAAVLKRAKRGGLDLDRVFLVGHSSGAQLAILLALDPSWLEAVSEAPARLAGVVSISGILDLTKETAGSKDEVAYLVKAFPEPAAAESLPLFGRYALTVDSFRLHAEDPRAPLADIPAIARVALLETHQCVSCHRVCDVGGQASHLRARDGAVVGAHALPLERYPAVVWKRFVFEQRAVAALVGANSVEFSPADARALYEFIVEERTRRGVEPWNRPERDRGSSTRH